MRDLLAMNRHSFDRQIGWALVAGSLFLVFGTLRGKQGVGPLFPGLMPVLGVGFAVALLGVLVAFCVWQKSAVNVGLVVAVFVAGFLLGYVGESFATWRETQPTVQIEEVLNEHGIYRLNYDWTRHRFVLGVGLSSLVLGARLLKDEG